MGKKNHSLFLLLPGLGWLGIAVGLLIVQLRVTPPVRITWETASEQETAGFYLLRSESETGPFRRVNSEIIHSKGSAVTGARYTFTDGNVAPGTTYYYVLEEVELDFRRIRHADGPLTYQASLFSVWGVAETAVCALIGSLLIFNHLKKTHRREPRGRGE